MIEKNFTECLILAKSDSNAMLYVLEKLKPLIRSYTNKLFFLENEDAQQELTIAIIEAVKKIPKCENDGQCIKYIHNAVKFKFAYLCKKNLRKEEAEGKNISNLDNLTYSEKYDDIEVAYDLKLKEKKMTRKKKDIMKYILMGYSDSEIANKLGVSRQYINRIKKSLFFDL